MKAVQTQTESIQRLLEQSNAVEPQNQLQRLGNLNHVTPQSERSITKKNTSKDNPVLFYIFSFNLNQTFVNCFTIGKIHGAISINASILRSAIIKGRTKTKKLWKDIKRHRGYFIVGLVHRRGAKQDLF